MLFKFMQTSRSDLPRKPSARLQAKKTVEMRRRYEKLTLSTGNLTLPYPAPGAIATTCTLRLKMTMKAMSRRKRILRGRGTLL